MARAAWVVVHIDGEADLLKTHVEPAPRFIDGLRDAVRKKMDLDHCPAVRLKVWKTLSRNPKARPGTDQLDPEDKADDGTHYWVEDPAQPPPPSSAAAATAAPAAGF